MIRIRRGTVISILGQRKGFTEIVAAIGESRERAVNYDTLTGPVREGDQVVLNTTAVHKQLGTGGFHFVMANLANKDVDAPDEGHIMKMRYAPGQVKVLAVEESEHPLNHLYRQTDSLNSVPVIIGTLHSMLPPAAAVLHRFTGGGARVVYLMTDGAALPLQLSNMVAQLKEKGLIHATVTCGHAFGGDLEAINIYSGLLAARGAAGADVIIVAMGPGIVGSASTFGYTGVEQGELVNAVNILGGKAVAIPRISFADARDRHRGLSHHTRTALGRVALTPCTIPLPVMDEDKTELVKKQIDEANISRLHRVVEIDASATVDALDDCGIKVTTMGRGIDRDREFFLAAGASGIYVSGLLGY